MHYSAKVDDNQAQIVAALRKAGRSVISLAALGKGIPDLIVSNASEMWLIEVKVPGRKGWKSEFTEAQRLFRQAWKGKPILTVYDPIQAIEATK